MSSNQPSTEVLVAHTADLGADALREVRALLADVYRAGVSMSSTGTTRSAGCMRCCTKRDRLVGHGSVIQRQLLHDGRARRTGYVEAVAVASDSARRGYGGAP